MSAPGVRSQDIERARASVQHNNSVRTAIDRILGQLKKFECMLVKEVATCLCEGAVRRVPPGEAGRAAALLC